MNNNEQQQQEQELDLLAIFRKYVAYWPWFVASALLCGILAFAWLRFHAPVYSIDASLLIKENDGKSNRGANAMLANMPDMGMFSMTNNFDNELEILKSRTLIQSVVENLNLYASVAESRLTGYNLPLYGTTNPLNIRMAPAEAAKRPAHSRQYRRHLLSRPGNW